VIVKSGAALMVKAYSYDLRQKVMQAIKQAVVATPSLNWGCSGEAESGVEFEAQEQRLR
jgi:hypothetical protein